jgi:uncharacterized membrane protein YgdD (TMEM256/DUF423 family)
MSRTFLLLSAVLGALSVILGAFAAHGLKKIVPPDSVSTFETGVRYQFYHTFALLAVAFLMERFQSQALVWSGYLFIAGIVLFSGSLYLLTMLKSTQNVGLSKIGIITPIGGLFFVGGWIFLFIGILKRNG